MIFTLTNICIPFSGSVEFGYMWNFKAINELWPNLWPQTIAEDGAHIVIWVRWIWWRCQNVTAHFANILSHLKKKMQDADLYGYVRQKVPQNHYFSIQFLYFYNESVFLLLLYNFSSKRISVFLELDFFFFHILNLSERFLLFVSIMR